MAHKKLAKVAAEWAYGTFVHKGHLLWLAGSSAASTLLRSSILHSSTTRPEQLPEPGPDI